MRIIIILFQQVKCTQTAYRKSCKP